MNRTEAFQILGIESTKDERAIKNAYREKLVTTNPEDNPEGFKELRAAYEEACRYAKEKEDDASEEKPRDTSPSGLWVEKAAEIYGNIHTRQDVGLWKKLFEEDAFLSLEDEENCRLKLLRFLMDHFKLPTEVWKLFDQKLSIVKDAEALRERFPADFMRYIVILCERGEDVDFSKFEGAEDGEYDLFLQYYERCWQNLQENKLDEAGQNIEKADALGVRHPVMEICRAYYLYKTDEPDRAVELLEKLCEKYPDDTMIHYNTAEILWARGGLKDAGVGNADSGDGSLEGGNLGNVDFRERAVRIYENLKAQNDSYYMANVRLTEWYYEKGQYRDAKKCAVKVLAAGGDDSFMKLLGRVNEKIEKELVAEYRESGRWEPALELCWCYLQDGRISAGIRLAREIETQLPEEKKAEYYGLLAKLYMEHAEYEDVIFMTHRWQEELEKKLEIKRDSKEDDGEQERNRNRRMQAHLIRIQCYYAMGFLDKENFRLAIEEGEKILTGTEEDIGVLLEMSRVYTEMGEYELALKLTGKLLDKYQIAAANVFAIEIYKRQLDAGGVVRVGSRCIHYFPAHTKAYECMAKVYLDLDHKEDLKKLCADAQKNGVKSVLLDAYLFQSEHKLMGIDELSRKLEVFRRDFRRPLEEGREECYAKGLPILTEYLYHYPDSYMLAERGVFHRAGHHYEEAKADLEKALSLTPANAHALYVLSTVYRDMGDHEKALFCVKRAILYMGKEKPRTIYTEMGNLHALLGDLEMALACYRQYEQEQGDKKECWHLKYMAQFHARLGNVESAEALYRKEYEQDNKKEEYYERLVTLYICSGMEEKARQTLGLWARDLKIGRRGSLFDRVKLALCLYINLFTVMRNCSGLYDGVKLAQFPYDRQISEKLSDACVFFRNEGWTELVFGRPAAALRAFDRMVRCLSLDKNEENEKLSDAVFAAILCGSESRGRQYSERLQDWLDRQKASGRNAYYNRPKVLAYIEFLASYHTEPDGKLQEILDRGECCEICASCTRPACRELESARVLLLLRQGKREEAAARVKRNFEIQPRDEFMRAIRHMAFQDI